MKYLDGIYYLRFINEEIDTMRINCISLALCSDYKNTDNVKILDNKKEKKCDALMSECFTGLMASLKIELNSHLI
jgi:hypothetical protein